MAWAQNPTAAETAKALHEAGLDPEECYLVRDVSLYRNDIKLYFNDGYLIFSKPVAGRRVGAVFAGGNRPGGAEPLLRPPRPCERAVPAGVSPDPQPVHTFPTAPFCVS